jgi:putative Mg2+ transporter-C (MgtC) family protein
MACGAGLPVLAVATTIGHFVIMFVFPKLVRLLPKERRTATRIRISYQDGRGLLRTILIACTNLRFAIDQVEIEREGVFSTAVEEARERADEEGVEVGVFPRKGDVVLCMNVKGKRPISHLIAKLSDIDGVVGVGTVEGPNELD